MLGRDKDQDRPAGDSDAAGYDPIGRFGAGALYGATALQFTRSPQNLQASNKPSEHNIANMLPRIVVAQLAPQTQNQQFRKQVSRRIVLRPGNSSLGAT